MEGAREGTVIRGNLGLKGICLVLEPRCEPLSLLFDHHGVLTDVLNQMAWIEDHKSHRFTAVKTQFESVVSHVRIVELLDHVKNRYVSKLEVSDEGSHRQFKHPTKNGRVTVSGHENHDLAPGTLNSILKQAGLKGGTNE